MKWFKRKHVAQLPLGQFYQMQLALEKLKVVNRELLKQKHGLIFRLAYKRVWILLIAVLLYSCSVSENLLIPNSGDVVVIENTGKRLICVNSSGHKVTIRNVDKIEAKAGDILILKEEYR